MLRKSRLKIYKYQIRQNQIFDENQTEFGSILGDSCGSFQTRMNYPFLLCFLVLSIFSLSQSQGFLSTEQSETPCSSFGRAEACDDTYNPVCASYSQYCSGSECQKKQFPNSCLACQDFSVYSYVPGPCPTTNQEEEYTFSEEDTIELEEAEEGSSDDDGGFAEEIILSTDDFEMPLRDDFDVMVYCGSERPTACADIDHPVCVIGCLSGDCKRTVKNDCLACSDPDVWTYSPGKCEKEKIMCTSNDVFEMTCDEQWEPVCAHPKGCVDESCATTVSNSCEACIFSQADHYTAGPCSRDLTR